MTNTVINLARPDIVKMQAYQSARTENAPAKICLDANENPWGELNYNRYPKQQPDSVSATLSALYGVQTQQMLVTRGSDEGIDLLMRTFCQAGKDKIVICPPTYGMYQVAAIIQGASVIQIPLSKKTNFSLDAQSILEAWQPEIKIIFLCNPNNPTGTVLSVDNMLMLCQKLMNKAIIVIDEAYIEFSKCTSMTSYLIQYPNLVVLRTLSKAYGLAGVRCGVTLANSEIIGLLKKVCAPYPVPVPIAEIVTKKINSEITNEQIKIIRDEKNKLFRFLPSLSYVKNVWESETNFILFEVTDANRIMSVCLKNGIVLRNRSNEFGLMNCLRVSIGTPDENQFLMEVLRRA